MKALYFECKKECVQAICIYLVEADQELLWLFRISGAATRQQGQDNGAFVQTINDDNPTAGSPRMLSTTHMCDPPKLCYNTD